MSVFKVVSQEPSRFFQTDSASYQTLATHLLQDRVFGSLNQNGSWSLEINRTPLFPMFLAGVYALFGLLPAKAMVIQSLFSIIIVALAFKLGRIWGNFFIALWLALLLSIEVGHVLYASQMMTETLFDLFFLGALLLWSIMIRRKQWRYGLLCGLMLGLGTLIRPILFYFGGVLCLLTPFLYQDKVKYRAWAGLAIAAIFAITVGPWITRNYQAFGLAQISTNQYNYMIESVIRLYAFQHDISYNEAGVVINREVEQEIGNPALLSPRDLARYYQQKFLAKVGADWLSYASLHIRGSLLFFVMPTAGAVARVLGWIPAGGTGLQANLLTRSPVETWQAFQNFYYQFLNSTYGAWLFLGVLGYELLFLLIVNIGTILGVIICLRSNCRQLAVLAIITISYFAAVTGAPAYDARYRLPVVPIMLLLTCLAAFAVKRR